MSSGIFSGILMILCIKEEKDGEKKKKLIHGARIGRRRGRYFSGLIKQRIVVFTRES